MKKVVEEAKHSLESLYVDLSKYSSLHRLELKNLVLQLEKILLIENFGIQEQQELIHFLKKKEMLSTFQKAYEKFETDLETEFARKLIKNRVKAEKEFRTYYLYDRYVILLKNEIKLAKIKSTDKVLFIGSGPVPFTALLIHKLTDCRVDCCESNTVSANLSKKVIKTLSFDNRIHVLNKNGVDLDFSDYTTIVIALLAKPKDKILKNMWKQIYRGTRVVYRIPSVVRQAFYEETKGDILKVYRHYEKGRIGNSKTSSSILFLKK